MKSDESQKKNEIFSQDQSQNFEINSNLQAKTEEEFDA